MGLADSFQYIIKTFSRQLNRKVDKSAFRDFQSAQAEIDATLATKAELQGKQDTLAFDGTYNAETNPAATVTTVNNAKAQTQSLLNELSDTVDTKFELYDPDSIEMPTDKSIKIVHDSDGSIHRYWYNSSVLAGKDLSEQSTSMYPTSGDAVTFLDQFVDFTLDASAGAYQGTQFSPAGEHSKDWTGEIIKVINTGGSTVCALADLYDGYKYPADTWSYYYSPHNDNTHAISDWVFNDGTQNYTVRFIPVNQSQFEAMTQNIIVDYSIFKNIYDNLVLGRQYTSTELQIDSTTNTIIGQRKAIRGISGFTYYLRVVSQWYVNGLYYYQVELVRPEDFCWEPMNPVSEEMVPACSVLSDFITIGDDYLGVDENTLLTM